LGVIFNPTNSLNWTCSQSSMLEEVTGENLYCMIQEKVNNHNNTQIDNLKKKKMETGFMRKALL